MKSNLVIKHAHPFIDVFSGHEGWEEHTRFQLIRTHGRKHRLAFVTGKKLSQFDFNNVKEKVCK